MLYLKLVKKFNKINNKMNKILINQIKNNKLRTHKKNKIMKIMQIKNNKMKINKKNQKIQIKNNQKKIIKEMRLKIKN